MQSTFRTRLEAYTARVKAADLSLLSKSRLRSRASPMLHKGGIAVQQGPTGLVVKTKEGTWTLAFYPNPGVKEAIAKLNGVQVTCMYKDASDSSSPPMRLTP